MATVDFLRQRGFGQRIGYGERPALIVIDLIRGFTDARAPLGSDLTPQVGHVQRVLTVARRARIPIFYTAVSYEEQELGDAGIWARKITTLGSLAAGSIGTEIDPRLGRLPNEPIIWKKYASAFFGTDLLSRLTSRRVDTVLIAGCTTSGCVRATTVDALQNGLRPIVLREAVGDRDQTAHNQSMLDMDSRYADVVDVDDAIRFIETFVDAPA